MNKKDFFQAPEGETKQHSYHTPLEAKIEEILSPFDAFTQKQITASLLLLFATVTALIWASLPHLSIYYETFIRLPLGIQFANFSFNKPLQFWVNDILLALFFFVVGLEIKREFLVGELADCKRATLVVFAALGGMIIPALIYVAFNFGTEYLRGWAIPMATDTAFALGVLAIFKKRLPKGIFVFVAALAIIDDIGALIVIAAFYTQDLNMISLLAALVFVGLLLIINYSGVRKPLPYLVLGIIVWGFIEKAGMHGTIAGILIAMTIPARPKKGPNYFIKQAKYLINHFDRRREDTPCILADKEQHKALEEMQQIARQASTPLQRWESLLETPIALLVIPLFAFFNAGIQINFSLLDEAMASPVALGIFFGLVIGKPIGIGFFSYLVLKLGIGTLPNETTLKHIFSAALLAGIGFTMSLFITLLAFPESQQLMNLAKSGLIIASLVATSLGIISLKILIKQHRKQ